MQNIKNSLPITLKSFQIENYAGILKTGLKDLPGDAQWIFLTGENGFGKTSVLRGIAGGLYPYELQRDGGEVSVEIVKDGISTKYDARKIIDNKPPSGDDKLLPYLAQFAAYGASRLEISHDTSSNEAADKSGRLYGLFRSDGVLLSVEAEMKIWEKRDIAYFNNLKNTLLRVLHKNIGDIYIDESDNARVKYVELDQNGFPLPPVSFGQLASAYRSTIAMIGDLLIRFYKIYPKDTPPAEFAGIVLIDELDVHQHPKMQRRIPGILSGVFPKIQFIATIHSPIPILGAPENAVFLKVLRTKEEGITVHHLDHLAVRGLTPNTLLSSPIFDFEEVIGGSHSRSTERIATEASYGEADFAMQLEQKLKEMARAANIDPNLIKK
jgi:hypothetical protein